jgi:hypothetical protein
MTRQNAPSSARLPLLAGLVLAALLLCACGASADSGVSAAAVRSTCRQVSGTLANGPDPVAEPAGLTEAQILPLERIHAPNKALASAISQLAAAYRKFFASNGTSSSAKEAVVVASKRINSFCPGAAS